MNYQELFLKQIRKLLPQNSSVNDVVATILNISYDAAHRRVSGKSKFSIEESIRVATHFNISLDTLFLKEEKIIVEKTVEISTLEDMLTYFRNSAENIGSLTNNKNAILYYSAKDIPLFYFMDSTILSKFKAYVWLNLLNSGQPKVSFEKFVIDQSFLAYMQKLKRVYETVCVKEIWNDTTINSSLQQILYFYESGLLNLNSANSLCEDLNRIITAVQKKCTNHDEKFSIYYNELILLNNTMLIETHDTLTMFVPYTLLGYFITDNENACKNVHHFFNQQITNSQLLNRSGIKEQNLFFNRARRKIAYYNEKLNNEVDLLF